MPRTWVNLTLHDTEPNRTAISTVQLLDYEDALYQCEIKSKDLKFSVVYHIKLHCCAIIKFINICCREHICFVQETNKQHHSTLVKTVVNKIFTNTLTADMHQQKLKGQDTAKQTKENYMMLFS